MHLWLDLITVTFSFGFLPGSFLGVSFGLPPWLAPSEVLLGGLLLWIYRLGHSMLTCVHYLILLKGLHVLYSVVHRLDIVRNDKMHPWEIYVAYEMFWGKFYRFWCLFCSCLGDILFVMPVMFHCWYYVPAAFSIWFPRCTIICSVIHNYSCARWEPYGEGGWYIVTAMEHYRHHK